jgi:thioredoxin-related protein
VGAGEKNFDPKEPLQASKAEIKWHDYDVGLKKAKDINRHVFIDFTAKWCGYCKKMDREVFSDPRIIDLLNNDFVSVRVDGDSRRELDIDGYKITEQNLAKSEFGVRGYPTFWFLKPDGSKLTLIGGYRPTDYMLEALTFVKDYKYDSTVTETDKDTLEN